MPASKHLAGLGLVLVMHLGTPVALWAAPLLSEQGAAGTSLAGSATARAFGPSSLFYNPAALPSVPGIAVEIGGGIALPHVQMTSGAPSSWRERLLGTSRTSLRPVTPPAVFASLNHGSFSVALGLYALTLQALRWPADWPGRQETIVSDDKLVALHPAVAYRLQSLSAGIGLVVAGAYVEHQRALEGGHTLSLTAGGAGAGFSAGLMFSPLDVVSMGVRYRSRMLVALAGRVRSTGEDALAWSHRQLPDEVTAGMQLMPAAGTRLSADVCFTLWSALQSQRIHFSGKELVEGRRYEDTFGLRAGVEQALFFIGPDVKMRAGVRFDRSPVLDGRAGPDEPWGDRAGAAMGLSWRVFGVTLDAGYVGEVGTPLRGQLAGARVEYRATTHLVSASVGYRYQP